MTELLEKSLKIMNSKANPSKIKIPEYLKAMNEHDKEINYKIIQNMEKRINYLRSSRFKNERPPITITQIDKDKSKILPHNDKDSKFRAEPAEVIFTEYQINNVYQILLFITNVSGISQRIRFVPPAKPEFSISDIQYPGIDEGLIAPGLSAIFFVNYNVNSTVEIQDKITIITEDLAFEVPIMSKKEHPNLNLPLAINCRSCWVGEIITTKVQIKNEGGDGGFKFFCEKEEDDKLQEIGKIKIKNFTITPSEFYLCKGESIELLIEFQPKKEGNLEESLILACDDDTYKVYRFYGKGNMLELKLSKLGDYEINSEDEELEDLHIESIPNKFKSKKLTISNVSFVPIKFRWKNNLESNDEFLKNFSVTPEFGEFEPNSSITFELKFKAEKPIPYFFNTWLELEDIPREALRSGKMNTQEFDENKNSSGLSSIVYYKFNIIANIEVSTATIYPNFEKIEVPLVINQNYSRKFLISNPSPTILEYDIRVGRKSSGLNIKVIEDRGSLESNGEKEIHIEYCCSVVSKSIFGEIIVTFDKASPLAYKLLVDSFVGPKVRVVTPLIDFKLIKSFGKGESKLVLMNYCEIDAEILIKLSNDNKISFQNLNKQLVNTNYLNNNFEIENFYSILKPGETKSYNIFYHSKDPESFEKFIDIIVNQAETFTIEAIGEVQDLHVSMSKLSFDIDDMYIGKEYNIGFNSEKHELEIQNLGNIPIEFKWETPFSKNLSIDINPWSGVIPPKSNFPINIRILAQKGKFLNEQYICNINGSLFPLSVQIVGRIHGLTVNFEIDEGAKKKMSKAVHNVMSSHNLKKRRSTFIKTDDYFNFSQKPRLERVSFVDAEINLSKPFRFYIKNTSDIESFFSISFENFQAEDSIFNSQPGEMKQLSKMNQGLSQTFKRLSIRKTVPGIKTEVVKPKLKIKEKDEIINAFTSKMGKEHMENKILERDKNHFLSSNQGVSIFANPHRGYLGPNKEIPITVTLFNDICGNFSDKMIIKVKGLEDAEFPVDIRIRGSPISLKPNQVGIMIKDEYASINLGTILRGHSVLQRNFKVSNTGPKPIKINWKIYDFNQFANDPNQNYYNLSIGKAKPGSTFPFDLNYTIAEPDEVESCFKIEPRESIIQGKTDQKFTLSFCSETVINAHSILMAKPVFEDNSMELNPVSIHLHAETIIPQLTVDKIKQYNGIEKINFKRYAYGECKKSIRTLYLTNMTKTNIISTFSTEGPFSIIKTGSNTPLTYKLTSKPSGLESTFNLSPDSHVSATISLSIDDPKNRSTWPYIDKIYENGKLILEFANGDSQVIDLEGTLLRPKAYLSFSGFEDHYSNYVQDFGIVHINNSKIIPGFICNIGEVPVHWIINYIKFKPKRVISLATKTINDKEDELMEDDSSVFDFSLTESINNGSSIPLKNFPNSLAVPNQIIDIENKNSNIIPEKFLISFHPKKNIAYKCRYRVTIEEGNHFDFVLKGQGTYDESLEV